MPRFCFKMNYLSLSGVAVSGLALIGFLMTTACAGDDGGESDGSGGASGGSMSSSGGTENSSGGSDGFSGGTDSSGGSGGQSEQIGVGEPCEEDSQCPMHVGEVVGFCANNWPEGYCTATCNTDIGEVCGPGAVCDAMSLGWCLKACTDDSDCRDGYYCADDTKGCEKDF